MGAVRKAKSSPYPGPSHQYDNGGRIMTNGNSGNVMGTLVGTPLYISISLRIRYIYIGLTKMFPSFPKISSFLSCHWVNHFSKTGCFSRNRHVVGTLGTLGTLTYLCFVNNLERRCYMYASRSQRRSHAMKFEWEHSFLRLK